MAEKTNTEASTSAKKNLIEHKYFHDPLYTARIQRIMESYTMFRECIRDGNCLYISYAVALADLLAAEKDVLLRTLIDAFDKTNEALCLYNIDELGYKGFYDSFVEILVDIANGTKKIEDVPLYSLYDCVAYLRLIVSTEIKSNPDKYQPYIPEMDVGKYCTRFVDPFYQQAGCVEICALSGSIPVRIHVVDITKDNEDVYGDHPHEISIFYTHGHFEPIYQDRCRAEEEGESDLDKKLSILETDGGEACNKKQESC
ncbi:putative cysteine protease [Encephalitozoon intestinalis ATCC 50506]|uniref:ubiquitinyl hydrolase 1 n=1 Tax=Encephalitozoon intestinalis (strain ATCC 50506) TaxID=876142 RepID=E0S779_ENCIT|nr:putative cysteine protease [Encephalitozoon intestinalis ATCC 50506]ADM11507.2 putative cysteine protease [Encephalitozoon intestinalis ATCC 50506]UTX45220.1 ubiquitin thioesterase otubain-like protein [Encephalitozoon intestinalis]